MKSMWERVDGEGEREREGGAGQDVCAVSLVRPFPDGIYGGITCARLVK